MKVIVYPRWIEIKKNIQATGNLFIFNSVIADALVT